MNTETRALRQRILKHTEVLSVVLLYLAVHYKPDINVAVSSMDFSGASTGKMLLLNVKCALGYQARRMPDIFHMNIRSGV